MSTKTLLLGSTAIFSTAVAAYMLYPSPKKPTVIFVLGGPGSGKGTQCQNLVKEFKFTHLSAGDLLRNELTKGTKNSELLESYLKDGKIVPMEITINLIKNAMEASESNRFLIDGFPRQMDQALQFEKSVTK
jgi:UMP-CMP kinase